VEEKKKNAFGLSDEAVEYMNSVCLQAKLKEIRGKKGESKIEWWRKPPGVCPRCGYKKKKGERG